MIRIETKNNIKKDKQTRMIIGLFVLVPFVVFLFGVCYLILTRMCLC